MKSFKEMLEKTLTESNLPLPKKQMEFFYYVADFNGKFEEMQVQVKINENEEFAITISSLHMTGLSAYKFRKFKKFIKGYNGIDDLWKFDETSYSVEHSFGDNAGKVIKFLEFISAKFQKK